MPARYATYFPKEYIQAPLKTDSKVTALNRAKEFNKMMEDYWAGCVENGRDNDLVRYEKAVKLLKLRGFNYVPYKEIVTEIPAADFANRINTAQALSKTAEKQAVMGIIKKPKLKMEDALEAVVFTITNYSQFYRLLVKTP